MAETNESGLYLDVNNIEDINEENEKINDDSTPDLMENKIYHVDYNKIDAALKTISAFANDLDNWGVGGKTLTQFLAEQKK